MIELQGIGYSGQPIRTLFRRVDPPAPVLVDLRTLFSRQPHASSGGYNPGGLQFDTVVSGHLSCWALCEQGFWWGWTTYRVAHGPNHCTVSHWIPAWMLERPTIK